MNVRRALLLDALCASFVLALQATDRGAVVLGERFGGELARATRPLRHTSPLAPLASDQGASELLGKPVPGPGRADAAADGVVPPNSPPQVRGPVHGAVGEPVVARRRGIHVPAAVVLAYARRGVVPGVNAVDPSGKAAGVWLRGVSSAGVGLQDGDRLVAIGRAPVRNVQDAVSIVSSALMAGHTQISGTVRRGDQELDLVVFVPGDGDGGAQAPPPSIQP